VNLFGKRKKGLYIGGMEGLKNLWFLYRFTLPNGYFYIGKTDNVRLRKNNHKVHHFKYKSHFPQIEDFKNKGGKWEDLTFEVIKEGTKKEIRESEFNVIDLSDH